MLTDGATLGAMSTPSPRSRVPFDARAWGAFGACGAIWGSTFLVISIGNDGLAPVWAATLRLVLASLLLTGWTLARGQRLPRGPALRAALGYGVAQFGVNLPLLYWGERVVPSGLAAVVYATLPLSSALIARAFGMERLTLAKMTGAVVALAGVAVLFSSTLHAHVPPAGLIVILVGATAAALGSVLLKRGPRQDPFGANAVGCAIGAVIAGPVSLALGEPHPLPLTLATAWPVIYLTLAGSLGAYVIMSWLVHAWPVTRTSYVTVIVPVIALGLGAMVRHERLGATMVSGAGLVVVGLLIGMRPERPRLPTASPDGP